MPIYYGSKKISEVYQGTKKISEVHAEGKLRYTTTADNRPYAMLAALRSNVGDGVATDGNYHSTSDTGKASALIADGGEVIIADNQIGGNGHIIITRKGNTFTAVGRNNSGVNYNGRTVNVFTDNAKTYHPVTVEWWNTGAFDYTYHFRLTVYKGGSGEGHGNKGSLFNQNKWPTLNNIKTNDKCAYAIANNTDIFDSNVFNEAYTRNVFWQEFNGTLPNWGTYSSENYQSRLWLNHSNYYAYSTNDKADIFNYSAPEGCTGAYMYGTGGYGQNLLGDGGQGGTGGRSANEFYNGNCLSFSDGSSGGCSVMNGVGRTGNRGNQYANLTSANDRPLGIFARRYGRDVHNITQISVGRGAQLATAKYFNGQPQNHSPGFGEGGAGGAGGKYDKNFPNQLRGGSAGAEGYKGGKGNPLYYTAVVYSDGQMEIFRTDGGDYTKTTDTLVVLNNKSGIGITSSDLNSKEATVAELEQRGIKIQKTPLRNQAPDWYVRSRQGEYWFDNDYSYAPSGNLVDPETGSTYRSAALGRGFLDSNMGNNSKDKYGASIGGKGGAGGQPGMISKQNGFSGSKGGNGHANANLPGNVVICHYFPPYE